MDASKISLETISLETADKRASADGSVRTTPSFICITITPAQLAHPGLAIATQRAGGVAILDWEFCHPHEVDKALNNLETLIQITSNQPQPIGVRIVAGQSPAIPALDRLQDQPHWVILSRWLEHDPAQLTELWPAAANRQLLLEITDIHQLEVLETWPNVTGLIARGHESGGWSSADAAFVLTQKLVAHTALPIYVQGGIGVQTAAACHAIAAQGVVLDDQLWLMPESPLSPVQQTWLEKLGGQEAILLGERLGLGCRVFSRPGWQAVEKLQTLVNQLELEIEAPSEQLRLWLQQAQPLLGWQDPAVTAWPLGQAVGLAALLRQQYRTTGRLIQAMIATSQTAAATALDHQVLQSGSALAQAHGTPYPIVQGPMTRVSDSAAFAESVANAGALPMLALALMKAEAVQTLLTETQARLGERPWGVGILGFVPHQLRQAQLAVVRQVKPPFALIAGGRPDQAAELEQAGITTYLHVPTAALLKLFLAQGARHFVLEGRECGGHVGPLSSFVLWESAIATLLTEVPTSVAPEIQVLFAGGIHDGRSAAMVAAMAAPLARQGMKVGVLMGTAYLFTEEAVTCGAILPGFQQVALGCDRTINLETGPGHASRCAVTPFAHEFYQTRRQLQKQQQSPEDIKTALEDLTLGRLRVASKGLVRQADGLTQVDPQQQQQAGMYMIGQVATLKSQTCTLSALHADVALNHIPYLTAAAQSATTAANPQPLAATPADVAIVGMATLLPKAQEPSTFWYNIVEKINALTEIPQSRWDWRLYFDTDQQARDKIYSRWGGFLDDIAFDPLKFGIPPNSLRSIEPMQLLTLEAVRRALADAGYADGNFDRAHTNVVLGAGGGVGDLGQQYALRSGLPLVIENLQDAVWDRLPEWTEESFPGLLLNVAAGRVANRFDLGGSNYIVDAACASSLAAIALAVNDLASGRCQVAIAGGVDTVQNPLAYMCFSKTQALSASGQPRPFDQTADGIVISEGIAVLVLKRLADAERDGDRIYAVIKAVEGSSDGKALGMTAPRPQGQQRAVQRAYQRAGFSPATVGLYEAHGTGTVAGDRAELETITTILTDAQAASNACALGSVKSLIGHTKASAGVAGLIKAALALYYQVRPGHAEVAQPLPALSDPNTPVCLLPDAQPWLASAEHPRRASVSAFGFGGTNFHALLEEPMRVVPPILGGEDWPQELLVWRVSTPEILLAELQRLQQALTAGAQPRLQDLAYSLAQQADQRTGTVGLAIVVASLASLGPCLHEVIAHLQNPTPGSLPPHIQLNLKIPTEAPSLAFLFPGQGAQYPNMGRCLGLYFPELRQAWEMADQLLADRFEYPLSQYILPAGAYTEAAVAMQKQQLTATQVAQPAIGTIEMGLLAVAQRLGINAVAACGHSYGEYAALYAAGTLSAVDFLLLSAERGRIMAHFSADMPGGMAAIQADAHTVKPWLAQTPDLVIANYNAPLQTIISGPQNQLATVVEQINASGTMARLLPVSGAFHSKFVAPAQTALAEVIGQMSFQVGTLPVYSNATAQPYPQDPIAISQQLAGHMVSPVNFIGQIEALYGAGIRVFLELGPKNILTTLSRQILGDRSALTVSLDSQCEGLRGFLTGLAQLAVAGVPLQLTQLYAQRRVQALDLKQLVTLTCPQPLPQTAWWLNGGSIRPQTQSVGHPGKLPTLTLETIAAAQVDAASPTQPVSASAPASTPMPESARPIHITLTPATRSILQPMSASNYPYPIANNGKESVTNSSGNGSASLNHHTHVHPSPSQIANSHLVPGQTQSLMPNGQPLMGKAQEIDVRLAAYQTYQATMQQFLALQERVISQFLTLTPRIETFTTASTAAPDPHQFLPDSTVAMGSTQGSLPVPRPRGLMQTLGSALPVARIDSPPSASITAPVSPPVSAPVSVLTSGVSPTPGATPVAVPMSASKTVSSPMPLEAAMVTPEKLPEKLSVNDQMTPLSREEMTQLLLDLVSDRTGYPTDMLGLNQDIEAELGIDSIKRVEIFGSLQKSLPSALASQLQGQMETLTRLKTLDAVIDQVLALSQSATLQEADCLGKSLAAADPLPRFTMHPRVLSVPELQQKTLTGLYLITLDNLGVAPLVAQALTAQGAQVTLLTDPILTDPTQLRAAVETARQQGGAIQGLLHLAPLGAVPAPNSQSWQQQTQAHVKALFHLLQTCATDLQTAEHPRILAVSGSGGHFGRTGPSQPHSVSGGGHTGLLKTLASEWPQVHCRAIDCDPSQSAATLAQEILTEMHLTQSPIEIGWAAGQRLAFTTVASPLIKASQTLRPEADWVVLVSGGHRGITAEVLKTLVLPGMTLVIVGRSPEPAAESPTTQFCQDLTELRQALVSQARQQGQAVSPASIEKALQTCLNQRETRVNLTWFRQFAQVDYRAVDVQDPEAFAYLIEDIYRQYGRLDAVIHGAGTIADKLLLDKTPATFEQVFDTKANSAFVLQQSLRFDTLKLLVFFSSVAGRYGSRGQCDYAAANELVNRLAWQLHWQWPHLRVVSLNWGPWDTTGMASPEVKRQFRERGIIPIPLTTGCAFFRQEILFGSRDDVEVIAGEGPWASLDSGVPSTSEEIPASEQPGLPPYPLLEAWPQVQPDSTVILDQALTLQSDPYLADHCLDGKPVLPAAVAAEWLAECVQAAWPDQTVVEVTDLQVLRGLVVPDVGVAVRFSGRASSHVDLLSLEVLAELLDPHNQRPYYRAVIRLQPTTMPLTSIPEPSPVQVPLSGQALSPQIAYRDYLFHGPAFQLAIAINAITPEGIDAQVIPSRCRDFKPTATANSQWLFDPGLVDVVPQLAIVWARVLHNTTPLPSRIGRLQRYGTAPLTAPLHLQLRIKDYQPSSLIYDAHIRDTTGVRLVMTGVEGSCSPALNRLAGNVKGDPS